MNIMCCAIGDVNKARDRGSDIIEGMDLYSSFGLAKLGPPEDTETKVDHRGVKSIHRVFNRKCKIGILLTTTPGFCDHFIGEFLENTVVADLIGSGKV